MKWDRCPFSLDIRTFCQFYKLFPKFNRFHMIFTDWCVGGLVFWLFVKILWKLRIKQMSVFLFANISATNNRTRVKFLIWNAARQKIWIIPAACRKSLHSCREKTHPDYNITNRYYCRWLHSVCEEGEEQVCDRLDSSTICSWSFWVTLLYIVLWYHYYYCSLSMSGASIADTARGACRNPSPGPAATTCTNQ